MEWNPDRLSRLFTRRINKRLLRKFGKRSRDLWGVDFHLEFRGDGERTLEVSVMPGKAANGREARIRGLADYLTRELPEDAVFHEGGKLIGLSKSVREFPKYRERLGFISVEEGYEDVRVTYDVREPFLKLNNGSQSETVFRYVMAPIIDWIQRRAQ